MWALAWESSGVSLLFGNDKFGRLGQSKRFAFFRNQGYERSPPCGHVLCFCRYWKLGANLEATQSKWTTLSNKPALWMTFHVPINWHKVTFTLGRRSKWWQYGRPIGIAKDTGVQGNYSFSQHHTCLNKRQVYTAPSLVGLCSPTKGNNLLWTGINRD